MWLASTSIYRLILGVEAGFFGNMLVYGLITILLILFTKQFRLSATKERMLIFTFIILCQIVSNYIVYTYVFYDYIPSKLGFY